MDNSDVGNSCHGGKDDHECRVTKEDKKVDIKRVDSMKEYGNRNNDESNIPINKNKKEGTHHVSDVEP
eukprot:8812289-Ditylum_brightwellii.AAC.1